MKLKRFVIRKSLIGKDITIDVLNVIKKHENICNYIYSKS